MNIDTTTQLCAVIGNPVAHSLSPAMHNAAFQTLGLNYVYLAFAVQDVEACLNGMRAMPGFRGMSVTIPHKIAVMPYLDEIDALAQQVGCVNTITCEDGRLLGSITDGLGTLRAFAEAEVSLEGKRLLFLGGGGAVRAVAFAALLHEAPQAITLLGRSPERLAPLVEDLRNANSAGVSIQGGHLEADITSAMESHDIIIQGTPLGMHGHGEGKTSVPATLFKPHHVAFDMVYRPLQTPFIRDAKNAGCKTILGLEMLVNQAVLQFETWTKKSAPREIMRNALLHALEE